MPFVKGQSGNPSGRPKTGESFATVLNRGLDEVKGGKTTRDRIAETVLGMAVRGNLEAAKWIVDRVEGKLTEKVETTVSGDLSHSVADATIDAVLERYAARRGDGGGPA